MSVGKRRDERDGRPSGRPRGTLQLEESQRSYYRQVEQLQDIDDKAMRSVRTAVVVIGFVVTATGIALQNGSISLGAGPGLFTGIGVFFLTITVVIGVGTSSVTEYRTQLSDSERARLEQPASPPRSRDAELVRIYHSWLNATEDELSESATFLTATLMALTLGVLSLLTAVSLAVVETVFPFEVTSPLQGALLHVGVVVSVLLGIGLATKLTIRGVNTYL